MPDRFRGRVVSTEGIKYKIKTLEGQRIHGSFTAYLKKRMAGFPEGTLVHFAPPIGHRCVGQRPRCVT